MSEHLTTKAQAQGSGAATAHHVLLLENDRTRITQWVFSPGEQTGWHSHAFDYITVQQSSGTLLLEGADGSNKQIDYKDGHTVAWTAPIKHNAVNISNVEVRVLEIELKKPA